MFLADITGTPTTKPEYFYLQNRNHAHKTSCAMCTLDMCFTGYSLCHITPYFVIFLKFCPRGFHRSVTVINRKCHDLVNKPPPNASMQKVGGGGGLSRDSIVVP